MSRTAFLFPGQGSQEPDMLTPFADAWPTVANSLERIADDELRSLLFEADAETLRKPANTQQAVLTTGWAVQKAFCERTGLEPDLVAGHSLGHITAATAAGVYSADDAVSLVAERGRLMDEAEREAGPGTMFAVSFASPEAVEELVSTNESVTVAGYNSPKQTVISGPTKAVRDVAEQIEERLNRVRTTELDVGSAFHSPVMEPAIDPFKSVLTETRMTDPDVPIVSDVTGAVYDNTSVVSKDLGRQLTSPIRWTAVVDTLISEGIERIIEFPPAGTLSTLTERSTSDLEVITLDSPADIAEVPINE